VIYSYLKDVSQPFNPGSSALAGKTRGDNSTLIISELRCSSGRD
jgi:hypothetical protein